MRTSSKGESSLAMHIVWSVLRSRPSCSTVDSSRFQFHEISSSQAVHYHTVLHFFQIVLR